VLLYFIIIIIVIINGIYNNTIDNILYHIILYISIYNILKYYIIGEEDVSILKIRLMCKTRINTWVELCGSG